MNVHASMIYPWIRGLRFKPEVIDVLAFLEVTDFSGFVIGEPYLIESTNIDIYKNPLRLKGIFVKIFQGSNMTHLLFKNIKGQIFSAPAQHSRFYKSPERVIVAPRLQQSALIVAINHLYGYAVPTDKHTKDNMNIENTVGYCLGNGWIAEPNKNP
jgi:hypothetical protein